MNLYNRTDIRPIIEGINNGLNKSIEEEFQNETLRPIIKLQHDLLIAFFREYISTKKNTFNQMSDLKKHEFIGNAFKKDNAFKLELKGLIIGHFTTKEFEIYCGKKSDYNKRILRMIEQRLLSVIQLSKKNKF